MRMHAAVSPGSMVEPTALRAKIDSIASRLARVLLGLHQLLFRLAVAGVFLRAGIQKARGCETTLALFADEYKLPAVPREIAARASRSAARRSSPSGSQAVWPRYHCSA